MTKSIKTLGKLGGLALLSTSMLFTPAFAATASNLVNENVPNVTGKAVVGNVSAKPQNVAMAGPEVKSGAANIAKGDGSIFKPDVEKNQVLKGDGAILTPAVSKNEVLESDGMILTPGAPKAVSSAGQTAAPAPALQQPVAKLEIPVDPLPVKTEGNAAPVAPNVAGVLVNNENIAEFKGPVNVNAASQASLPGGMTGVLDPKTPGANAPAVMAGLFNGAVGDPKGQVSVNNIDLETKKLEMIVAQPEKTQAPMPDAMGPVAAQKLDVPVGSVAVAGQQAATWDTPMEVPLKAPENQAAAPVVEPKMEVMAGPLNGLEVEKQTPAAITPVIEPNASVAPVSVNTPVPAASAPGPQVMLTPEVNNAANVPPPAM